MSAELHEFSRLELIEVNLTKKACSKGILRPNQIPSCIYSEEDEQEDGEAPET